MHDDDVVGPREAVTFTVEVVSPGEVDAGTDMEVTGRVSCSPARDLRGVSLKILDHDGAVVADGLELVEFDGKTNTTGGFVVKAPVEPKEYTWSAILPRLEEGGVGHVEANASFTFMVNAHATRMVVWEVPSAVPMGEAFRAKVGIKCSAGCDQAGREFEIYDHDGKKVASGIVGGEPWPGTAALYVAEAALEAPTTEGTFRWEARTLEWDSELPHRGGAQTFGVRIVHTPDYVVTVEAVDKDKQTPIAGMEVILHPFRARTDEHGVAKLSVPKGEYKLYVSGLRYFPFRTSVDVTEDMSTRAELEWEVRPEKIR